MFSNYFKVAVRNLIRNKSYAVINVLGLSVAFASCILVFLYVRNEYSVNRAIPDCGRIYRIGSDWKVQNRGIPVTTLAPVGPILARTYPEVEAQARLFLITATVHAGQRNFKEDVIVTDSSFFNVFNLPLVRGSLQRAFQDPLSVVITNEVADKIYGTTDVIGKTIRFDVWGGGQREYVITAVCKKLAWNSITNFGGGNYGLIVPFNSTGDFISREGTESWESRYLLTFVKLQAGILDKEVQRKLDGLIDTFAPVQYRSQLHLRLEPFTSIYLDDDSGSARRVCSILTLVVLLILVVACVNLINLTVARSLPRAKEIAVRSVLGASRGQSIVQLLVESFVVSLGAAILAVAIAEIALRNFLLLFGRSLVLEDYWGGWTILFVGLMTISATLLAGLYPALMLTSRNPVNTLKGLLSFRKSGSGIRPVLIILQFTVAIILLVSVSVISHQLSFILHRDVGFDDKNVLVIDSVPREWSATGVARMTVVENGLRAVSGVASASLSFDTPTYRVANSIGLRLASWDSLQSLSFPLYVVDESFADTYGIAIKDGRFFSLDHPTESSGIVLNESAVSRLGLDHPVGTTVLGPRGEPLRIVGVVRDFNFESLHSAIRPLAFRSVAHQHIYRAISLKLAGGNPLSGVGQIERKWKELLPDAPCNYYFVDQSISAFYTNDKQLRNLLSLAAGLALLIAGMGIYGLVFLSVAQRVKEIGIRKVLGASIADILLLFTRDTVKWVLVANVLAWPVAYYVAVKWLAGFAYRTEVSPWTFVLSGTFALLVALGTIISHAIKAATANPVESLRYE